MSADVLELAGCPACGEAAEVVERTFLDSTNGPLEHVRLRCITGKHLFNMPGSWLGLEESPS